MSGAAVYVKDGIIYDYRGKVLVYDFFIRDSTLYFISTFENSNGPELTIKIGAQTVQTIKETALKEPEPVRYFSCPYTGPERIVAVINGCSLSLSVPIVKPLRHGLAICTLFKHESPADVLRFVEYYRMQGVTAFYLYYNGPLRALVNMPQDYDIIYKAWDFNYWNTGSGYRHCAQSVFLTMVRCRYLASCDWLALIDLDEFISGSQLLSDYLKGCADVDVIRIRNYWSTRDGQSLLYSAVPGTWTDRTKCIYRGSFRGEFAIHGPKVRCKPICYYKELQAADLKLLHVIDVLHPDRKDLLVPPLLSIHDSSTAAPYQVYA